MILPFPLYPTRVSFQPALYNRKENQLFPTRTSLILFSQLYTDVPEGFPTNGAVPDGFGTVSFNNLKSFKVLKYVIDAVRIIEK